MKRERRHYSIEYRDYLESEEWKARREAALERGRRRCALCHSVFDLQVHHATYKRLGDEEDGDLVVLCGTCHRHHHKLQKNLDRKAKKAAKARDGRKRAKEHNDRAHMLAESRAKARNEETERRLADVQGRRPARGVA